MGKSFNTNNKSFLLRGLPGVALSKPLLWVRSSRLNGQSLSNLIEDRDRLMDRLRYLIGSKKNAVIF